MLQETYLSACFETYLPQTRDRELWNDHLPDAKGTAGGATRSPISVNKPIPPVQKAGNLSLSSRCFPRKFSSYVDWMYRIEARGWSYRIQRGGRFPCAA